MECHATATVINYLVIQYSGTTVNNGAKTLNVAASVQTSCPGGGVFSYYGIVTGGETVGAAGYYNGGVWTGYAGAGATFNSGNGTLTISGNVCIAGVPAKITLTPNANLLAGAPIVLNSTYQALQTQSYTTAGAKPLQATSLALPDGTALLIGVGDTNGTGYWSTCAQASRLALNGSNTTVANGIAVYCAGSYPVSGAVGHYLMGY